MSRQETIVIYLIQKGCTEVMPPKSRKYRQLISPKGVTYWIGRAGAIRKGRTISGSISLTDRINFKQIAEKVREL